MPTFGGICMHLNDENGCTHPYVAAANAPLFKTWNRNLLLDRQPFLASSSDGVSLAASQSLETRKKKWKLGKLQETWKLWWTCSILNDSDDDAIFFFFFFRSFLSTSNLLTSFLTYQEDWTFEEELISVGLSRSDRSPPSRQLRDRYVT